MQRPCRANPLADARDLTGWRPAGFLLAAGGSLLGTWLIWIGIGAFSLTVLF
jgi:hypothetical protein